MGNGHHIKISFQIIFYWLLVLVISQFSDFTSFAHADIYTYTDESGVVHFSNAPASNDEWRLIIKERHFDSKKLVSGGYDNLIHATAVKHGVDPLLVKAVIKAESDFDTNAVSNKGAKGLMQLMPETAEDMGVDNLFDPVQNIEGGVKYLKRLIDTYRSNLPFAIAAYNAGEKSVQKYNGMPPYRETKSYVRRVLGYLRVYKDSSRKSFEP